jgi:apolipoprotein N-acyltransferase
MDTEPPRLVLAASAFAGAIFWAGHHLVTTLWAGQSVAQADVARVLANVAIGMLGGVLAAYFLGPALVSYVPVAGLKDPHVVGFATGAGTWELAPFAYALLRGRAGRFIKEKR